MTRTAGGTFDEALYGRLRAVARGSAAGFARLLRVAHEAPQ